MTEGLTAADGDDVVVAHLFDQFDVMSMERTATMAVTRLVLLPSTTQPTG